MGQEPRYGVTFGSRERQRNGFSPGVPRRSTALLIHFALLNNVPPFTLSYLVSL